jgi:hypothetical protein
MAVLDLLVAMQPSDPVWELPLAELQGAALAIVGWVQTEAPRDAGVPRPVANVLAGALTARYNVTYPKPAGKAEVEGAGAAWGPVPGGWGRTLRPGIALFSTHQAERAAELFETELFVWSRKTQLATLSPIDAPPALSYSAVRQLLDRRFDVRRIASEAGIEGLLLPGVDGDFAALCCFRDGLEAALANLRRECEGRKIGFQIVPESDFRSTQWFRPQ